MARLVVKSSFMSAASPGGFTHLLNYVGYIATREGVELNDDVKAQRPEEGHAPGWKPPEDLPPTEKQERMIRQLLEDFPDSAGSLEYEDYKTAPSMATASEFIGRTTEDNFGSEHWREDYVYYLATRPGAERNGEHGLWGATDEPLDLDEVAYRVANHDGNVWTHIISLRREDAVKTGMEDAQSWRELVRSQAGTVAQAMGIPAADLRWYAAYHNESHHPHIHMVAYSVGAEPFLGKKGLQEIKSGLAGEIFREELMETYQEQTQYRDDLTSQWRSMLDAGDGLPQVEAQLQKLAAYLSGYTGRAVYGYLPKAQRELVDQIVDKLGQSQRIQELYTQWYEKRDAITGIYKGKPEQRLPLSQNKAFEPLKNAVIQTAVHLAAGIEPDEAALADEGDLARPKPLDPLEWPEDPVPEEPLPMTGEEWLERYPYPGEREMPENTVEIDEGPGQDIEPALEGAKVEEKDHRGEKTPAAIENGDSQVAGQKKGWWTQEYKNARHLLYGSPTEDPKLPEAFAAMKEEAATGNPLAQYDLGRMLLRGMGTDAEPEAAQEQFQKALKGFKLETQGKCPAYWQYRIGKMYAMGYGMEQDPVKAADWYERAVKLKNPFAAYALAGQYLRGQGVEADPQKAFQLYEMAATDKRAPNAYAKWELAKLCEKGQGTPVDMTAATTWYASAYQGFQTMENRQLNDDLVYRLGYMEYKGLGTEQDIPAAIKHFERAQELGNPGASYYLAKLCLEGEYIQRDVSKAQELLERLKENDFYAPQAEYQLGKLYLEEPEIQNVEKGLENLELAVEKENPYAAYKLARILTKGELTPKDIPRAVDLLEHLKENENFMVQASYRLGKILTTEPTVLDMRKGIENLKTASKAGDPFADYALGRIYFFGKGEYRDKELGQHYLHRAAEQGNEFAAQTLEKIQEQGQRMAAKQEVSAALGLMRIFERALRPSTHQQREQVPNLRQRREELEKKQAQGMKMG